MTNGSRSVNVPSRLGPARLRALPARVEGVLKPPDPYVWPRVCWRLLPRFCALLAEVPIADTAVDVTEFESLRRVRRIYSTSGLLRLATR
jgi:hypothetical protein